MARIQFNVAIIYTPCLYSATTFHASQCKSKTCSAYQFLYWYDSEPFVVPPISYCLNNGVFEVGGVLVLCGLGLARKPWLGLASSGLGFGNPKPGESQARSVPRAYAWLGPRKESQVNWGTPYDGLVTVL
jgi:hypothetical protein